MATNTEIAESLQNQLERLQKTIASIIPATAIDAIKFLENSSLKPSNLRDLYEVLENNEFDFHAKLEDEFDWFITRLHEDFHALSESQKESIQELSQKDLRVKCLVHRTDLQKVTDRNFQYEHRIRHKYEIYTKKGNNYIMYIEFEDIDSLIQYFTTVIPYTPAMDYSYIENLEKPYIKENWY